MSDLRCLEVRITVINTLLLGTSVLNGTLDERGFPIDSSWDLQVVNGNLADCYAYAPVPPSQRQGYALAQDVASAARLFLGELWYDTTQGLPYFQEVLGYLPSLQFLKSQFVAAALTVPGVATAVCYLTGLGAVARRLGGQIQITDSSGQMVGYVETTGIQDNGAPWYVNGATMDEDQS